MKGNHVPVVIVRTEIRHVEHVADRVDVPAQRAAHEARTVRKAFPVRRDYRAVHGVVAESRSDLALPDSVERRRTRQTRKLRELEKQSRRLAEGRDVRRGPAITDAQARERKPAQRVAGENREALRVGVVVLLERGIDRDLLPQQDSFLARGVVVVLVARKS